ncbi:hypothetical protein K505DRAFT_285773 [Melanomma pulvis-pyrius CBS 109.77]|uniref:Uncharacterized protein n=1 Tax=Melanomma pulvis-pyrius CBS 109.77 TaxID=1314802 RepID=A0A6A6WWP6_9PLEO|nr:hypothetical protein K505DRAFT_285773 [Melanomma pulvis-pyrius CBS 109.77]
MSIEIGAKALKGEEEYIEGKLFEAVNYARTITVKGTLIQIYDPTKDMSSPAYWEYEDEANYDSHDVPAGYKVCVTAAFIQFL